MRNKIKVLNKAISAGILIGIGAFVKMQCDNQIIGSLLFSIGLFFICSMNMNLFTGKIAYIDKTNWKNYPLIWIGNLIGCSLFALLIRLSNPNVVKIASSITLNKLNTEYVSIPITAFFCGIIMYLAVDNYKTSTLGFSKIFGIVIGVMVFLLCNFEHSIADMAYVSMAINSIYEVPKFLSFIAVVSIFNGIGSVTMKKLLKGGKNGAN